MHEKKVQDEEDDDPITTDVPSFATGYSVEGLNNCFLVNEDKIILILTKNILLYDSNLNQIQHLD